MDISCRVNSLYEKLKVRDGLSGSPSPYIQTIRYTGVLIITNGVHE